MQRLHLRQACVMLGHALQRHLSVQLYFQHIFFLRLDPSPQILGDVSLLDHARFLQKAKRGG